ncbi:hypothetical protein K438DRAFT_1612125, partial [Mycena galopus ATCC 62051]
MDVSSGIPFAEAIALALAADSSTLRFPTIGPSLDIPGDGSDIARLPTELLSKIFMLAIGQHAPREPTPLTMSPTTISHVGRRWRQVALATGNLWTTIVLTFPTSSEQITRTLVWLARSKTCPLDIFLDFRDPEWDWEEDTHGFRWVDMEAVLTHILLPFAPRWRTLELLTDTWAPIFAFLVHTRPVGASLNELETLSLARCNAYLARRGEVFGPAALGQHLPLFGFGAMGMEVEGPPGLRQVMLTGVHIDWSVAPLANLARL